MNKLILFFAIFISVQIANAQSVSLFLKSNFNQPSFFIPENSRVTVDLNNRLELKGKLHILNDSMITVDDTAFSIYDIDFIGTRNYNNRPNPSTAYGAACVATCLTGLPIFPAYFIYDLIAYPKKFFNLKKNYSVSVFVKGFSKNHQNNF